MTVTDFSIVKALSEAKSETNGTSLVTYIVPGGYNS
ncbi:MAG: hypothetical protein Edafosvirus1_71 [Edafosvirus sp.]|uniref:Uncharacterized protein n=1 Tax=Edafosvirus sp. TaxID=2487765 RepID=A0A3G4ZS62_9VIRU|nr:MAG: hypothetical protein Edafosvirus1_71 [Edafosvirus sp.]